jgi:DNA-directed RNA polymerase
MVKPIGEEGIYWLKVHVANCGAFDKIDKKPIEERVAWVDENLPTLMADMVEQGPAEFNLGGRKRTARSCSWLRAGS